MTCVRGNLHFRLGRYVDLNINSTCVGNIQQCRNVQEALTSTICQSLKTPAREAGYLNAYGSNDANVPINLSMQTFKCNIFNANVMHPSLELKMATRYTLASAFVSKVGQSSFATNHLSYRLHSTNQYLHQDPNHKATSCPITRWRYQHVSSLSACNSEPLMSSTLD